MNRRNFLTTALGGTTLISLNLSCGPADAETILNAIDNVLGDSEVVITTVEATTSLAAPVFSAISTWLNLVKTATDQALVIDDGAVSLSPTQLTQIISLYSQAVVFSIPGVPIVIQAVVKTAIAGISTLLTLLNNTKATIQASGVKSNNQLSVNVDKEVGMFGGLFSHSKRKMNSVKSHAKHFGGSLTKMNQLMATKLTIR